MKRAVQSIFHAFGWHLSRHPPADGALPTEVPGDWHVDFIVALAKVVRPSLYVELGVRTADLFNRMVPYADQLVGVDIDPAAGRFVCRDPKVEFVCVPTHEYAETLRVSPRQPIDMLFIDADHARESVVRDFRDYFPFVGPHGLILLHDTHPGDASMLDPVFCNDAYKAIEELQQQDEGFEMLTIPVSPGLTLCRKRTAQLSWME